MFNKVDSIVQSLNTSKIFAAFIMLMLNIGSRFINVKFSKTQEHYLKNILGKQVLIFAVSWMGTRDIYIALIITFIFTIVVDFILNEDSNMCVVPETLSKAEKIYDLNNDGIISDDEIHKAQEIIKKAELQKVTNKHKTSMLNANMSQLEYYNFI